MENKNPRLDIPGFSFGLKTGETVDVPKIYGGRPQPKKSGRPHSIDEIVRARGIVSTKWKTKALYAKVGKQDYSRRKRVRTREYRAPITNNMLQSPCNRRFFEYMGDKAQWLKYVEQPDEQPELFISKAKVAYEIVDDFLPIMTTTSAKEALIMCATLAKFGIAARFNRIVVPRY